MLQIPCSIPNYGPCIAAHLASQTLSFGTVENGILPYLQPAKIKHQHLGGFVEVFSLELKVLRMNTKCVSKIFISSVFISDKQCLKIQYFGRECLHTQMHS